MNTFTCTFCHPTSKEFWPDLAFDTNKLRGAVNLRGISAFFFFLKKKL